MLQFSSISGHRENFLAFEWKMVALKMDKIWSKVFFVLPFQITKICDNFEVASQNVLSKWSNQSVWPQKEDDTLRGEEVYSIDHICSSYCCDVKSLAYVSPSLTHKFHFVTNTIY